MRYFRCLRAGAALAAALQATACSVTANVIGYVSDSAEVYTGSATGYASGNGTIEMVDKTGDKCAGSFHYTGSAAGVGAITCSTGERATFQFVALSMDSGYGFGSTDKGRNLRFTFGLTQAESEPYIGPPPTSETAATTKEGHKTGEEWSGTAFFVSSNGDLLTNNHVAADCTTMRIRRSDGMIVKGETVALDPANDLALIKAEGTPPAVAEFLDGAAVKLGEDVIVFGYPLPGVVASSGNLTTGTVSALEGVDDDQRYLQISAQIQPGNSGGPALDQHGRVIGVVTYSLDALEAVKATGTVPQNVNFILKASYARAMLDSEGVNYRRSSSAGVLSKPDIGDLVQKYTAQVLCKS
jgi:S1-C subfamily serine protease